MRTLALATTFAALTALPALAQPMNPMAPMMGMGPNTMSCVSGGQFVPCPPGTQPPGMGGMGMMQPRPAMAPQPMPERRMTRAEQRRMMREQRMQQRM